MGTSAGSRMRFWFATCIGCGVMMPTRFKSGRRLRCQMCRSRANREHVALAKCRAKDANYAARWRAASRLIAPWGDALRIEILFGGPPGRFRSTLEPGVTARYAVQTRFSPPRT